MSSSRIALLLPVVALSIGSVESARAQSSPAPGPPKRPKATAQQTRGKPSLPLSDDAELARVTGLYQAGKYGDCVDIVGGLLDPSGPRPLTNPRVIEQARVYHGACLIGVGKPELADAPFREAIRQNPQMAPPDGLMFPTPVVDRFIEVRETLLNELRAAEMERVRRARERAAQTELRARVEARRVRALELLARRETLVSKNSRWLALAPFGIGQFQNRDNGLGWVFLTSELSMAALALTSTVVISHLNLEASQAGNLESPQQVDARLRNWHTLFEVSSWSFLTLTAAGIVQAELAFVPEFRDVRWRELPANLRRPATGVSLTPEMSFSRGGLYGGLTGRF